MIAVFCVVACFRGFRWCGAVLWGFVGSVSCVQFWAVCAAYCAG